MKISPVAVVLTTAAVAALAVAGAQFATTDAAPGPEASGTEVQVAGTVTGVVIDESNMLVLDIVPVCGPEAASVRPIDWTVCVYGSGDPYGPVQFLSGVAAWKAPDGTQHEVQVMEDVVPCEGTVAPMIPGGTAPRNPITRCYWDQTARGVIVSDGSGSRYVMATVVHNAYVPPSL